MSDLNNYDLEQMLYQFVDGELPPENESILFAELSSNDDLRADMKDLMSIREAVLADTEAFNPPAALTSNIYKKIGMIPPSGIATQSPLGLWLICKRYAIPVAAALLIGFVSYFNYDKFINHNTQNNIELNQNFNDKAIHGDLNKTQNNLSVPKVTSLEKSNLTAKHSNKNNVSESKRTTNQVVSKETKIMSNDLVVENKDNITNINQNDQTTEISDQFKINNSQLYSSMNNVFELESNKQFSDYKNSPAKFNPDFEKVKLYDISFRGITSAASFPAITQSAAVEPILTNIAIGSYMHQWENFRIGIELGQEPFGQQFKNQDKISYVNQSSLLWGAIGFQGTFNNPIINKSSFYSRVLLGSSQIGPLGKVILGVQYQPFEVGYALQLGIEGSMLSYQNQGTSYLTKKVAITYGISWIY